MCPECKLLSNTTATISTIVKFKIMLSISTVQDGVTGLFMASQEGHEEVVRVLLQSGAKDTPDNVSVTFVV